MYLNIHAEKNNEFSGENIRLRTGNMVLEKENTRLQKVIVEKGLVQATESNLVSLKQVIRECRKEILELKNENLRLKRSAKHTRLMEIEQ